MRTLVWRDLWVKEQVLRNTGHVPGALDWEIGEAAEWGVGVSIKTSNMPD